MKIAMSDLERIFRDKFDVPEDEDTEEWARVHGVDWPLEMRRIWIEEEK